MAHPYAHNPPQNRMRQPSGTPRHQNSTGQFHPAPPSHHVARNNHSHAQRPGPPPQHPPVSYAPAGNHYQGNKNNHSATVTQFSPPTPRNRGGCCRWPENRHCCSCFLPLLAFLIWIIAITLGSYATAGCTSTMTGGPSLYVAELRTNTSEYQTNLGIGYFGACLTFTSSPSAPSDLRNDSKSTPPGQPDTFCIKSIHNEEQDSLVEQFYEGLAGISKGDPEQVEISRVLNLTLPIARHIQQDIFGRGGVPVASLVLLGLGAIFLFAGLMVTASRKAHMTALMVGCVMGAISVGLLLVMDVGVNGQAMNGLMGGDDDVDGVERADGVYLYRAGQLRWVVIAATIFAAVFYLLMGWMYIRRSAYGKNPIGDWVGKWVNGPGR